MQLRRRQISAKTVKKFEDYAAEIFTTLGMDLNTPATQDTPRRLSGSASSLHSAAGRA